MGVQPLLGVTDDSSRASALVSELRTLDFPSVLHILWSVQPGGLGDVGKHYPGEDTRFYNVSS